MEGDVIKATIEVDRQVFHNGDDWGIYSVLVDEVISDYKPVTDYKNRITIKGNMPELKLGELYNLIAKEVDDNRYGLQYDVKAIFAKVQIDETDSDSKKRYLAKLYTESQVKAMYEALDDPFDALKNENLTDLVNVKGCGVKTATIWCDKFKKHYSYAKIYLQLEEYDLSFNMIKRLMNRYNNPDLVISKVKNNPYTLSEVNGIGWKKADELAQKGGMLQFCVERISAFIIYYLTMAGNNGRSYISSQELMDAIIENIGEKVPDLKVTDAVRSLGKRIWSNEDKTLIGLRSFYNLELGIATEFKRLLEAPNKFEYGNWESVVKRIEQQQGWDYTDEQIDGIKTTLENNVVIIQGYSGTGKSTITNAITTILKQYPRALAALAGRAGARLAEITGETGFTIHRLLGFPNRNSSDDHMFAYNEDNPLPYDIIIIDEVSMIGGRLFYDLLKAIPTGSKLIMLGDCGQLPAIGECNVASDIINSPHIPTISLTKIHRQAAKSAIITDSIRLRTGKQIIEKDWVGLETRGELQDFTIDAYSDKTNTYYKVMQHFSNELTKVNSILDLQVIAPTRSIGDASVYSLNNSIQELYNPSNRNKSQISCITNGKPFIIREGDKVINRKNNYKVLSDDGEHMGLFNGDIGIVRKIEGNNMIVDFVDKGRYFLTSDVVSNLELAYAITCHSFQGSQAERVIVAFDYSSYILLSREWVYTAITRAQKHCTLVCQNAALRYATMNESISDKTTHLTGCLEEVFDKTLKF